MVDRKIVEKILTIYGDAWVSQDPKKILTIFTKDACYHERVLQKPLVGHEQIERYWQTKVVDGQSDIEFKLLNVYVDGKTAIAEWEASFYHKKESQRIHMREVAILEFRGDKIVHLREYWHSEPTK